MTRRARILAAAALAAVTVATCLRSDVLNRPLRMDNRLYFYLAERAASGVPPHLSAPDVKTQLSVLVEAMAIRGGRAIGIDDLHAGRFADVTILAAGVCGTAASVLALGAAPPAAFLGGLAALSFSGLAGHAAVGFNPKILLFALMAWTPWLVARGRFLAAGATAASAMMCWQPAACLCVAAAVGALAGAPRMKRLALVVTGGVAATLAYEAYFLANGVFDAQVFQNWVLPLGSVHDEVDWMAGLRFVAFGSPHGLDRFAVPAGSFAIVALFTLARPLGLRAPQPGRAPAPAPALVTLVASGLLASAFTCYDHQAEPDRFLLCAAFATAMGLVIDRGVHALAAAAGTTASGRLEGLLLALLLMSTGRGNGTNHADLGSLAEQRDAARMVGLLAETHGSVWAYGCPHLLGMAHLTNAYPLAYFWDDLAPFLDEDNFRPVAHGRMPDVIVRCLRLPRGVGMLEDYTEAPLPGVAAEKVRAFVRTGPATPGEINPRATVRPLSPSAGGR